MNDLLIEPAFKHPVLRQDLAPVFITTLRRPPPLHTCPPIVLHTTFDPKQVAPFLHLQNFPKTFMENVEETLSQYDPYYSPPLRFRNGAHHSLPQGGSVHFNVVHLPTLVEGAPENAA